MSRKSPQWKERVGGGRVAATALLDALDGEVEAGDLGAALSHAPDVEGSGAKAAAENEDSQAISKGGDRGNCRGREGEVAGREGGGAVVGDGPAAGEVAGQGLGGWS